MWRQQSVLLELARKGLTGWCLPVRHSRRGGVEERDRNVATQYQGSGSTPVKESQKPYMASVLLLFIKTVKSCLPE